MLLIFPLYARPHHFTDAKRSIISRLGFLAPLAPAMLSIKFVSSATDSSLHRYLDSHVLNGSMWSEVQAARTEVGWISVAGVAFLVYFFAIFRFAFNKALCSLWRSCDKPVQPAPFSFYLVGTSSAAVWIYIYLFAGIWLTNYGIAESMAVATKFVHEGPIWVLVLIVLFVYLFFWFGVLRNSESSELEIYQSRTVAAVNLCLRIVLLIGIAFLIRALSPK